MFEGFRIAVIIPALNEQQSLPHVLGAIPRWVDDVVVVDNGSTDRTAEVAARGGAYVIYEPQRGYGAACLAGVAATTDADILVFLDADYSDHPEQMDRLIAPISRGQADLVIGSRTLGQRQRGALTLVQRWGNFLSCFLMRALWKHRYTDLGPFRAVRATALDFLDMNDRTYGWTIQMQIRALRAGLHVFEVPVDYRRRIGRSKISRTVRGVIGAGAKILSTIVRERLASPSVRAYRACSEHLIVFTRYPEPGKTKTRLIPALGPAAAAALQRDMTAQALLTVERLRFIRNVSSEVRFAGGDRLRMAKAFGRQHLYLPQHGDDLGARMHRALVEAFVRGAERAIIIGTDCPALDCDVLDTAFDRLRTHDCVIGPARDGGYYLLGLRKACRPLFEGVAWGAAQVFEQTIRNAITDGLTVHVLPELADIDEPHDLPTWEKHRHPRMTVIIPTLNEAAYVAQAVQSARTAADIEVIVADGGSRDGTPRIARDAGARVVRASPGRARQMNAGAAAARGAVLLFLHADTRLPPGFAEEIELHLANPDDVITAFRLEIDHPRRVFRWIERLASFRSTWLGLPYGDQALAVRATTFYELGGFRDLPIMEDFDLVRRVSRLGRVKIARSSAATSARRWLADGVLRTTLVNQACVAGWFLGVPADRLARWRGRRDENDEAPPTNRDTWAAQSAEMEARLENRHSCAAHEPMAKLDSARSERSSTTLVTEREATIPGRDGYGLDSDDCG